MGKPVSFEPMGKATGPNWSIFLNEDRWGGSVIHPQSSLYLPVSSHTQSWPQLRCSVYPKETRSNENKDHPKIIYQTCWKLPNPSNHQWYDPHLPTIPSRTCISLALHPQGSHAPLQGRPLAMVGTAFKILQLLIQVGITGNCGKMWWLVASRSMRIRESSKEKLVLKCNDTRKSPKQQVTKCSNSERTCAESVGSSSPGTLERKTPSGPSLL